MNNQYHEKIQEYINFAQSNMYIFEIVSEVHTNKFILMYKEESLAELYNKVLFHFGFDDIRRLCYYSTRGQLIKIPRKPNIILENFVEGMSASFTSMYGTAAPRVYRVILE